MPPFLPPTEDEPGYALSICSADFNEWVSKNASTDAPFSYVWTPEYEIFEWNMGNLANYAELAMLMSPRPFMVERGHASGKRDCCGRKDSLNVLSWRRKLRLDGFAS